MSWQGSIEVGTAVGPLDGWAGVAASLAVAEGVAGGCDASAGCDATAGCETAAGCDATAGAEGEPLAAGVDPEHAASPMADRATSASIGRRADLT